MVQFEYEMITQYKIWKSPQSILFICNEYYTGRETDMEKFME